MSLPDEQVRAQQTIREYLGQGKIPLKYWPKHLISSYELSWLFEDNEKLLRENEKLRASLASLNRLKDKKKKKKSSGRTTRTRIA